MLIEDLGKLPDTFKSGYRGIMLLRRNKDGGIGNAQRNSFKTITNGVEQWEWAVKVFRHMQETSHQGYRIYASVNARNMQKAIHEFKRRQLEFDYGNNAELDDFYRDIDNRFFSCLMNPSCREESNFLIDCDTVEEYERAKEKVKDLVILDYATKNGRHIITHPFNPNGSDLQIKKDDLLSIA